MASKECGVIIDHSYFPLHEYVRAIGNLVDPSTIILCSKISRNRVRIFFNSPSNALSFTNNNPTINVLNLNIKVRMYVSPYVVVYLNGIDPWISNSMIANILISNSMDVQKVDYMSAGIINHKFKHVKQEKRFALIKPCKLPSRINFKFENSDSYMILEPKDPYMFADYITQEIICDERINSNTINQPISKATDINTIHDTNQLHATLTQDPVIFTDHTSQEINDQELVSTSNTVLQKITDQDTMDTPIIVSQKVSDLETIDSPNTVSKKVTNHETIVPPKVALQENTFSLKTTDQEILSISNIDSQKVINQEVNIVAHKVINKEVIGTINLVPQTDTTHENIYNPKTVTLQIDKTTNDNIESKDSNTPSNYINQVITLQNKVDMSMNKATGNNLVNQMVSYNNQCSPGYTNPPDTDQTNPKTPTTDIANFSFEKTSEDSFDESNSVHSDTIIDNFDETIPGNKEIQKDPLAINSLPLSKSARKRARRNSKNNNDSPISSKIWTRSKKENSDVVIHIESN